MYTVRKIRNLAKLGQHIGPISETFMLSTCLLLKKGLLLKNNTLQSLIQEKNTFKVKEFRRFLDTEERKKIQENFKNDDKIYQTFSNQMGQKFDKEVSNPEYKSVLTKYSKIKYEDLSALDKKMREYFRGFWGKLSSLDMSSDKESQYCLALLHFYHSINSDTSFPFLENQIVFDWNKFESENVSRNAKAILKNIMN